MLILKYNPKLNTREIYDTEQPDKSSKDGEILKNQFRQRLFELLHTAVFNNPEIDYLQSEIKFLMHYFGKNLIKHSIYVNFSHSHYYVLNEFSVKELISA